MDSQPAETSDALIALLVERVPGVRRRTGAEDRQLRSIEQRLDIELPPTLRRLIAEFGVVEVPPYTILGATVSGGDDYPSIVGETLDMRKRWGLPPDGIVVTDDGMGGIYWMRTSRQELLYWAPGQSNAGDEIEVVAPSLEMFVATVVEDLFPLR